MKTLYMHTLDGQPAEFQENGNYVAFAHRRIKLASSLRQIRREQQAAIQEAWKHPNQHEWADLKHYGYVTIRGENLKCRS